jgi:hypothetical protein
MGTRLASSNKRAAPSVLSSASRKSRLGMILETETVFLKRLLP